MLPIESGEWIENDETDRRVRVAREMLERIKLRTPEEKFQSLVRSGIYTADGRLRKEYGGEA